MDDPYVAYELTISELLEEITALRESNRGLLRIIYQQDEWILAMKNKGSVAATDQATWKRQVVNGDEGHQRLLRMKGVVYEDQKIKGRMEPRRHSHVGASYRNGGENG